jgi:hypothetical protein
VLEFVGWFCYGGSFYMSVSGGWFCVFIVGVLAGCLGWLDDTWSVAFGFFFFFLAMYVWRYLWIFTFYLLDGV